MQNQHMECVTLCARVFHLYHPLPHAHLSCNRQDDRQKLSFFPLPRGRSLWSSPTLSLTFDSHGACVDSFGRLPSACAHWPYLHTLHFVRKIPLPLLSWLLHSITSTILLSSHWIVERNTRAGTLIFPANCHIIPSATFHLLYTSSRRLLFFVRSLPCMGGMKSKLRKSKPPKFGVNTPEKRSQTLRLLIGIPCIRVLAPSLWPHSIKAAFRFREKPHNLFICVFSVFQIILIKNGH